jgi:hypothetical protein
LRRSTSSEVRLSWDGAADSVTGGVVVDTAGAAATGAGLGVVVPPPSAGPVLALLRSGSFWSLHLAVLLYGERLPG